MAKRIALKHAKSYIDAIQVGPVWTKVILKLRTDRLAKSATKVHARRAKRKKLG
jgi:hypothetical protein